MVASRREDAGGSAVGEVDDDSADERGIVERVGVGAAVEHARERAVDAELEDVVAVTA